MSRHTVRDLLFKLIYEYSVLSEQNPLTYLQFSADIEKSQEEYFVSAYNGVIDNFDFLKDVISRRSQGFSAERIFKVDLSIMLLAAYEILFDESIPDKVSVNEALEISKTYSTPKSSKFINGVLATVIKDKPAILDKLKKDKEEAENSNAKSENTENTNSVKEE